MTSKPDIEALLCPPESHSSFPFSYILFLAEAAIIIQGMGCLQEKWHNESPRNILQRLTFLAI
jgi:hypothetical protein